MGKIKTEGRVTLEFDPDLYEISITVRAEGKTSGAAVTAGKKQTETLLQSLQDSLQIKPEQISAESEEISIPYSGECYVYQRELMLKIPADNKVRETVTGMLADMDDVSYSVNAELADKNKQKQTVLDAAVQCAREKAEHLAGSMQCKVSGFEEIVSDGIGSNSMRDAVPCLGAPRMAKSMAADLQNPKIKISGEVTVIWLTEPLT